MAKIKIFLGTGLIGLFFLGGLVPVHAAFDPRYDSKEDLHGQYEAGAEQKLTRGLTNIIFGWTEIGTTPAAVSAGIEHGPLAAFFLGVPYGAFRAAGRTVVGAYETATFFAPQSPIMKEIQGDVR